MCDSDIADQLLIDFVNDNITEWDQILFRYSVHNGDDGWKKSTLAYVNKRRVENININDSNQDPIKKIYDIYIKLNF